MLPALTFADMNKILEYNDNALSYSLEGKGPCLLLLHGFLEDMRIWDGLSQSLSGNYSLLRIDLPGHGGSGLRNEINHLGEIAELVNEVLKKESISECTLLGHSMGGYVAMEFAARFPRTLKGLILLHSHAAKDNLEARKNRLRTIEIVKAGKQSFIQSFIPTLFSEQKRDRLADVIARQKERASSISGDHIIASMKGMMDRKDHVGTLASLQVPVLFITGKDDCRIPPPEVFHQAGECSHAEVVLLGEVGHMGFFEAPEIIFPIIDHFMQRFMKQ